MNGVAPAHGRLQERAKLKRVFSILRVILLAIMGLLVVGLAAALLSYPPEYVRRVLVYTESDAFDYLKFPSHALKAAPVPNTWCHEDAVDKPYPICLTVHTGPIKSHICPKKKEPGITTRRSSSSLHLRN